MRVLITGSSGQLGQSLSIQKNHPHKLIAFSRTQLDITDADKLNAVLNETKSDVVINLAAYTNVDKAETEMDLAFAVNSTAVKNLAQLTNQHEIPIIHLSTDYVFSGDKGSSYLETDTPNPVNVYGKSKLAGEIAIRECNPKHIILRSSWIFSDKGKNFLNTILQMAKQQKTISVVNDQIGGPTCADDLASFLIKLLNQLPAFADSDWGVYHYSGAPYVSWFEFAQEIICRLESDGSNTNETRVISISTKDYASVAVRPANSCLSTEKVQNRFGITPPDWRYKLKQLVPDASSNMP
jgi:dTDP-4-dehydrorhamnose reductase